MPVSREQMPQAGSPDPRSLYEWANELIRRLNSLIEDLVGGDYVIQGLFSSLGGRTRKITLVTDATYTIRLDDEVIDCNRAGTITLTLPEGAKFGQSWLIQDSSGAAGTNAITVNKPSAGGNINGGSSVTITNNYGCLWFTNNGSEFVAHQLPAAFALLDGSNAFSHLNVIHTAAEADEHAVEIIANAAGFGDVKAFDIDYITGAIAAGQDEAVILINIDESLAAGGTVYGLEVLATEGNAAIGAIKAGALVAPISQSSGTFEDMDSFLIKAVDNLSVSLSAASADVFFFLADNDTITIGDAAKYSELEFILSTGASGAGIKPTFEFWNGSAWVVFTPTDGTNGFKNTGLVLWELSDIAAWAVDANTEYAIRITRTRNSLGTVPVGSKIQISSVTLFAWDKDGNVNVNSLSVADTIQLGSFAVAGLPSAAVASKMIYVSDETGGAVPAFSDGTNWRRVTDRAIVS